MNIFGNGEFENYKTEANQRWRETPAYAEYAEKSKDNSPEQDNALLEGMESVLAEFALCLKNGVEPHSASAQTLVKRLQNYITENFYTCTNQILAGLGQMYIADERFKSNIDKHGGGTAEFISRAIRIYCG